MFRLGGFEERGSFYHRENNLGPSPLNHSVIPAVPLQIGAFLSSSAQCVVVGLPSNPDPPFVVISAPDMVGNCDDLTLDGSTSSASPGMMGVLGVSRAKFDCLSTKINRPTHHRILATVCSALPSPSSGTTNVTWEVALAGGDQSIDISNVSRVLDEVRNNSSWIWAESTWDGSWSIRVS